MHRLTKRWPRDAFWAGTLVLCFGWAAPADAAVSALPKDGSVRVAAVLPNPEYSPLGAEKKQSTKKKARKKSGRKRKILKTHSHRVIHGETLSEIAELYDVTVEELKKWNQLKSEHKIRAGKRLKIRGTRGIARKARIDYVVQDGDILWDIAKKFGVNVEHLKHVNRMKNNMIRPGDELVVYAEKFTDIGMAKGRPNNGHLTNGQRMPPMRGLRIRHPTNSYGAWNTINGLKKCFARLHRRYPPFVLGDISRKGGGSFPPHLSHQNGLDVDLAYVPRQKKFYGKRFNATKKGAMHAWKTWNLIQCFLQGNEVEYIFIDIPIQKQLYHAARKGKSQRRLRELFSFLERKGVGPAIIRTSPGHDDHMHIRFRNIRPKRHKNSKKRPRQKR